MKVLFDTNPVVYWLAGERGFEPSLKSLLGKAKRQKATFYVSMVTVQEIMVFATLKGERDRTIQFLRNTFARLPFDERCALEAARIGAENPLRRTSSPAECDLWQRDIAILGTASAHGLDVVVTANEKDFVPYKDLVTCDIQVLHAVARRRN